MRRLVSAMKLVQVTNSLSFLTGRGAYFEAMKLEEMTWLEVELQLDRSDAILLPTGSVEQHGPLGLIGTDAICAREIAWAAAELCEAVVAPEISYAPAPFNMGFPGTVSVSREAFVRLVEEVVEALGTHGFGRVYVLNGHGANLDPLTEVASRVRPEMRVRSWWDFEDVNALRAAWYGDWEGMHATPSEVSITRFTHREVVDPDLPPPPKLSVEYIAAHAGDRHGSPDAHRREFPDGRVGSHSALARRSHGKELLATAAEAVARDFREFAR